MKKPYLLYRRGSTFYYKLENEKTYHSTGKTKEGEAHRYVLEEILGKPAPDRPKRTPKLIDYALPAFEKYIKDKMAAGIHLSDKYVKSSRSYIKRFVLTDPIAAKRVGEIKPGDFEDFQTRLFLEESKGQKTTAKRALEVLRLLLRRAYRRGEISQNPTDGVIQIRTKAKERTIYELAELERLFPKDVWEKGDFHPWKDAYDYAAFITAAASGMRKSEVLSLRWRAINLEDGVIQIRSALKGNKEGLPKSGRPRATPIFDEVMWPDRRAVEALKNLKRLQLSKFRGRYDEVQKTKLLEESPVFGYVDGEFRKGTWWQKRLRAALEKAGIDREKGPDTMPLDSHSLRHTLASHLKGRGISGDLIRQFCGWSCARIQASYTHIEPEVLQSVMEKIRLTGTK